MSKRKGPARYRPREEFWRRIVTRQPMSGLSIRDWCARHEVTEASFYAWRRTLARRGILRRATDNKRAARLVAVEVAHEPNTSAGSTPLGLVVNGLRIEIASGFDEGALRRLISILREAASC
jgi:Transposase